MLLSEYLIGRDDRTAYELPFGKPITEDILEFGELVMARAFKDKHRGTLTARWTDAVYL